MTYQRIVNMSKTTDATSVTVIPYSFRVSEFNPCFVGFVLFNLKGFSVVFCGVCVIQS
jgi:hypothetical protein